MAIDKNGKLTYEMKSPGQAWMEHVEKNMGASNVTPAYLNNTPTPDAIQKGMADLNKKIDAVANMQPTQQVQMDKQQAVKKEPTLDFP